jgi:2,3-bisphosphoglycerate-dependent phosphoglycerate mutase
MATLFILRHLKSQWNFDNRFTGWTDVPLSIEGIAEAKKISEELLRYRIDNVYSSPLIRNMDTVLRIFESYSKYPIFMHLDGGKAQKWGKFKESANENYIPVYISENINERYYGNLQGLNKDDIREKYGEKKFMLWRRSFKGKPPGGESLKDTLKRAVPFYKKYVEKDLKAGKNVLVVGSHNSLRSIVKYIEKISDDDISGLEIPYGGLIKYEFDSSLKLLSKK